MRVREYDEKLATKRYKNCNAKKDKKMFFKNHREKFFVCLPLSTGSAYFVFPAQRYMQCQNLISF
jgi:hypothetical protein